MGRKAMSQRMTARGLRELGRADGGVYGPLQDEAELAIIASDGMPMTVTGLMPHLEVVED